MKTLLRSICLLAFAFLSSFSFLPRAHSQSPGDCFSGFQNGDSIGLWSFHENALMNVSQGTQQVRVRGNADSWSLFYVWTFTPWDGNKLNVDLQMRNIDTSPNNGHLGATQKAFKPWEEYAYSSWGQNVNLQNVDGNCNLQFADTSAGVMGPNDKANQWMQSGQGNNSLQLAFRYRQNVSSGDFNLGYGDVEFYSGTNYTGQAWVLHINGPLLGNFPAVPFLNDAVESIRFGTNSNGSPIVGIVAYTDINSGGTAAPIAYDIPDLSKDPRPEVQAQFNATSSISISLLPAFVAATKTCIDCDLRHVPASLFGNTFAGINLTGAVFDGADLSTTSFNGANLTSASLRQVNLRTTDFSNATMNGAILDGDALAHAVLSNTRLSGASMQCVSQSACVDLSQTDLSGLCMSGGLSQVNLTGANLSGLKAVCSGGPFNMHSANLTNVNLSYSNLPGTDFSEAMLNATNLNNSTLGTSNFSHTSIACSSFQAVNLSQTVQLGSAKFSNCGNTRTDWTTSTVLFNPGDLSLNGVPLNIWKDQLILNSAVFSGLTTGANCPTAFSGRDFSNAQMENFQLPGCPNLTNVKFNNADLNGARFTGSTMTGSTFLNATLSGAFLDHVNLSNTDFTSAILSETNAERAKRQQRIRAAANGNSAAHLTKSLITGSKFTSANLAGVDMTSTMNVGTGVSFSGATLVDTDFSGAFLESPSFSATSGKVNAEGINFRNAILIGADFSGANLASGSSVTNFTGTVLYGSTLTSETNVQGATFAGALFNATSGSNKLPAPDGSCQPVFYQAATLQATTNNTVTCPNSAAGPCTKTSWYVSTPPPSCTSKNAKHASK